MVLSIPLTYIPEIYIPRALRSVTPALDFRTGSSFPSSAISFEDAVRNYLLAEMTDNILKMFYEFDHHSDDIPDAEPCSRHLRVTLAFASFVIHRLRVPYHPAGPNCLCRKLQRYGDYSNSKMLSALQRQTFSGFSSFIHTQRLQASPSGRLTSFSTSSKEYSPMMSYLGRTLPKYPSLDPCRLFALEIYSRMIRAPLLPNAIIPQYSLLPGRPTSRLASRTGASGFHHF